MNRYISAFKERFDREWFRKHIIALYRLERGQKSPCYQAAAAYARDLMLAEGIEAELIDIPADGVTTYQDKRMPLGWDVNEMSLTLVTRVNGIKDPVLSDYQREPLSCVKHSTALPKGGVITELVTESQMKAGEDVRGKIVFLNQATKGAKKILEMCLDLGAIGFLSERAENKLDAPDYYSWVNSGTENGSWSVQAGHRDFVGYQTTPRIAYELRKACEEGVVKVHARSDGQRYESTLPVVTGLLRGESEKEIWVLAHLYEPLIDDNSNGVIGCIGILKALKAMADAGEISLKYSVRVVFAAEVYGFAAAAEHFGGKLSDRAIGAINVDGIPGSVEKAKFREIRARKAPDWPGFAGNIVLDAVCDAYLEEYPETKVLKMVYNMGDDCTLADPTVGLPTTWILRGLYPCIHHNSILDEEHMNLDVCLETLVGTGAWVGAMAALTADEIRAILPVALAKAKESLEALSKDEIRAETDAASRMEYRYLQEYNRILDLKRWGNIPEIDEAAAELENWYRTVLSDRINNPVRPAVEGAKLPFAGGITAPSWYKYSDNFIFGRVGRGLPHDQVKISEKHKRKNAGLFLYYTSAELMALIDGKKTLRAVVEEFEWAKRTVLSEAAIRDALLTFITFAQNGYLTMKAATAVTAAEMENALRELGVKNGETIIVHAELNDLGHIDGGVTSVLDGLKAAVGDEGTILAPIFSHPYLMRGGKVNRSVAYRPYDMRPDGVLRDKTVTTADVPRELLKTAGVCRSGHVTNEWAAIGHDAYACAKGQGCLEEPFGENSPVEKVLERGGSVVCIGNTLKDNAFLAYLANRFAGEGTTGVIKYIDKKGAEHTALMNGLVEEPCKAAGGADTFYEKAQERGLEIRAKACGMGCIYRIELKKMCEIGAEMFS